MSSDKPASIEQDKTDKTATQIEKLGMKTKQRRDFVATNENADEVNIGDIMSLIFAGEGGKLLGNSDGAFEVLKALGVL